jgi:pyrroloquinoline-quinone synthase
MPLTEDLSDTLRGRELLSHPFYQRWERGELEEGELGAYAAQYHHFERQLPRTLAMIVEATESELVRDAMRANLDDELSNPCAHVELLGSFLAAVDATPAPAAPATERLVALYDGAAERSCAYALGVVAAYEVQSAAIARSKGDGLREHYGLDDDGTRFWDVHAQLEAGHAQWVLDAADTVDHAEVIAGVGDSRDAWWSFLDEREALAAA